jgi:predicted MFS family arabinose efflux permease
MIALGLTETIQTTQSLGIAIEAQDTLPALLRRDAEGVPDLAAITVVDASGSILFATPLLEEAKESVVVPVLDDLGQRAGAVRMLRHVAGEDARLESLRSSLMTRATAIGFGIIVIAGLALTAVGRRRAALEGQCFDWAADEPGTASMARTLFAATIIPDGFGGRLSLVLVAALTIGLAAIAATAVPLATRLLVPETTARAEVASASLARQVERALAAGVPLDGLVGARDVLDTVLALNPEFAAARLTGRDGRILAEAGVAGPAGAVVAPVLQDGALVANVTVVPDPSHVWRSIAGLWVNLGIVTIVTVLLAVEFLPLILGSGSAGGNRAISLSDSSAEVPANAREARPPLFLFMLGHEMTRPFLPSVAIERARGLVWIGPEAAVSVAISLLLVFVAALILPMAVWSARRGRGPVFRVGCGLAAFGYAAAALSPGYIGFLVGWGLVGAGFAMVFAAAQGAVLDATRGRARTRGLTVMVGAIMVAALCGPPVGGLLADRVGPEGAFAIVILATLAALRLARSLPTRPTNPAAAVRVQWRRLFRAPALASLVLGVALPAKLMLAGLCFYLIPVEMLRRGAGEAEIGRLQMVYPLATIFLVPVISTLAAELRLRLPFVLAGQLLSALAAALVLRGTGDWTLATLLLVFGVAQSLLITPQAGLVGDLVARYGGGLSEDAAYGAFRLVERGGSALGPVVAGIAMARFGFTVSVLTLGAIVLAGAVFFLLALWIEGRRDARPDQA